MDFDIPPAELDSLRRRIASRREGVPIRYRGGPLDGLIDHKGDDVWRWANITGWCVRDVRGRVVQMLYQRSAEHAQVYEFRSMDEPRSGSSSDRLRSSPSATPGPARIKAGFLSFPHDLTTAGPRPAPAAGGAARAGT